MRSRVRDLEVDLVISAGDLPWDYLEELVALLGVPAVFVPGNHEPPAGRAAGSSPRGLVSADDQILDIGGLRVAGLGGCVRYNDGDHQFTQKQFDRRARRLLRHSRRAGHGADVLVTHAPPLGLGDEPDPTHVGVAALHAVVETLQPSWHLHGHIHPHGMRKPDRRLGATTIRNVIPWNVIDVRRG